jgi:hypothetical protein
MSLVYKTYRCSRKCCCLITGGDKVPKVDQYMSGEILMGAIGHSHGVLYES